MAGSWLPVLEATESSTRLKLIDGLRTGGGTAVAFRDCFEATDHPGQSVDVVTLQVVGVGAAVEGGLDGIVLIRVHENYHWDVIELRLPPNPTEDREATAIREGQIDNDQLWQWIMGAVAVNADALKIENSFIPVASDTKRIIELRAAEPLVELEKIFRAVLKQKYDAISFHYGLLLTCPLGLIQSNHCVGDFSGGQP